jgi:F-type H+-transporting ATPase subunit delta
VAEASQVRQSEVAVRYAHAAFDLALEAGGLEAVDKDFDAFSAALTESADLREALRSPLIDPEEKSRALVAVAEKLGASELGRNLIGVLAKNGRAAEFSAVASEYKRLYARHRGVSRVEIVSAKPLSAAELAKITSALGPALGKVETTVRVDESLIGGFIVQAGSRQFDASIKSKLANLKIALKGA